MLYENLQWHEIEPGVYAQFPKAAPGYYLSPAIIISNAPENIDDVGGLIYNAHVKVGKRREELNIGYSSPDAMSMIIINDITPSDLSFLQDPEIVEIVGLEHVDISVIDSLSNLFCYCDKLEFALGLETWNTSHITDMSNAFQDCSSFYDISSLAAWDISNVENMSGMFWNCRNMYTRQANKAFSTWNTGNVRDMSWMFTNAKHMRSLNGMKEWDTANVENMKGMFSGCYNLRDISGIGNWDVSRVANMERMFEKCCLLKSTRSLLPWNMESVSNIKEMFSDCVRLEDADKVLSLPLTPGINALRVFRGAKKLDIPAYPLNCYYKTADAILVITTLFLHFGRYPTLMEVSVYTRAQIIYHDDEYSTLAVVDAYCAGVPFEDIAA